MFNKAVNILDILLIEIIILLLYFLSEFYDIVYSY